MTLPPTYNGKTFRHSWAYRDSAGEIIGYTARYDGDDGDKAVIPFFNPDGNGGFTHGIPDELKGNVPLYGKVGTDTVFVVEGEKCVDALLQMGLCAVTSQGGAQNAHNNDWTPLKAAQRVIHWPDNDESGHNYVKGVAAIPREQNPSREILLLELPDLPESGDVVDWIQIHIPDWDGYSKHDRIADLAGRLLDADSGGGTLTQFQSDQVTLLAGSFGLTDEIVAGLADQKMIYKQVFPAGSMTAIVGAPGSGKTHVMYHICASLKGQGYRVLYVNADCTPAHLKQAYNWACAGGYQLLAPDMHIGKSMSDVITMLYDMSNANISLDRVVLVLDTLKKCVPPGNKNEVPEFYSMLRRLVAKGATVFALGHCLKYRDPDGWPIYEGCGDLRADWDGLACLIAIKDTEGVLTTSLYREEQGWESAKTRCIVEPQSWSIDTRSGMTVRELPEWVNTKAMLDERREEDRNSDDILTLCTALSKGPKVKTALYALVPRRRCEQVLKAYDGTYWESSRSGENNAILYTAIPDAKLPAAREDEW